ncbi:MAG: PHP-associated domain-containing protein [Dehalococcoidia bacterium]
MHLALPPIAGSDCHAPHEAGTAATVLARPVDSECELVAELRRGAHQIRDLRVR